MLAKNTVIPSKKPLMKNLKSNFQIDYFATDFADLNFRGYLRKFVAFSNTKT